ncbi:ribonuclease P protein component [bacterium]|nr:MAG: ribonuclease P protein component [bacterium]
MLPKKNRLSKTAEVNLTTAKGRTFFSPSFLVKFLNKPEIQNPQITVIASTKVSKSAVVRNRLKRIVRQGLHDHVDKIKPGYYVFVLKHSATATEPEDIRKELLLTLKKSKII